MNPEQNQPNPIAPETQSPQQLPVVELSVPPVVVTVATPIVDVSSTVVTEPAIIANPIISPATSTILSNQPELIKKQSKVRAIIIFIILAVAIIGAAVVAWVILSACPMKEYSYSTYSISLPETYIIDSNRSTSDGTLFVKTVNVGDGLTVNNSDIASVYVSTQKFSLGSRPKQESTAEALLDENSKSNIFKEISIIPSDLTKKNYKKDNVSVYMVSGKYTQGMTSGIFREAIFVSDTNTAEVHIDTASNDAKFSSDADRIIQSFKLK